MRVIRTLLKKDILSFLTDPVAMALSFAVPLVMIVIFGFVFSGSGDAISELNVLAVNEDSGPAGRRLLRAMDETPEICILLQMKGDSLKLDSVRARHRVEQGKNSLAIVIPKDFSEGLRQGEIRLSLLKDPRDPIVTGVVEGMLKQSVFQTFPGLLPAAMSKGADGKDSLQSLSFNRDLRNAISKNFGIEFPDTISKMGMFPEAMLLGSDPDSTKMDSGGFSFGAVMDGIFHVKSEAVVGKNIENPGVAQSVAGPAVMFLLFAVGAIGASLLTEIQHGTAQRLLISGVKPGTLLFSKYLYAVLLGSAQLVVLMIFGKLIFSLNIFAHPVALLVMIVCTSAATSGLGLCVAAISRTDEQASGYGIVMNLGMSAIGGAMFPSFMIPAFIRTVAFATPVHWAMQGFLDIFWRNQSLGGIVQECAILLGMAALLVVVSIILFRKRLSFDLG